jgi:FtsZ-binding cell division protein ZapB
MNDDTQRTMQFILEQQAQLTATVGQLSATVDRLAVKVDRNADGITALLAIAEIHEREIEALKDGTAALQESTAALQESTAALQESTAANAEAGRATDERLNALINVVEQMISERRGGGDRPA